VRKGVRTLLSGKLDEVLRQGLRVAVLDHKYGNYRVDDPRDNVQLSLYAVLVVREDASVEEVTCQIVSPFHDFEPVTYTRDELDQLHQSVLVVLASLADPGEPVAGDHCHFCPGRLVCRAAREQAEQAMLARVVELPLGEQAAELLDAIRRAQALFKEVESYYKRVLEEMPGAIPGWTLEPGYIRREITDTAALSKHTADLFSTDEFLSACSVSVPQIEKMWAKKNAVPVAKAREPFKKFVGNLLAEKRSASSLKPVLQLETKNQTIC
jgi:hypothetical protein